MQENFLSGTARSTKLKKAQDTYEAFLKIEPSNAFALRSLGDVLKEQAFLLSGPARSSKLNEAQNKLEASLDIEPNNASALKYLDKIKEAKNRQIESEEPAS